MISIVDFLPLIFIIGIAVMLVGIFVLFLVRFLKCPKENTEERKQKLRVLIAFGAVLLVIAAAFGGFFLLISLSIRNM